MSWTDGVPEWDGKGCRRTVEMMFAILRIPVTVLLKVPKMYFRFEKKMSEMCCWYCCQGQAQRTCFQLSKSPNVRQMEGDEFVLTLKELKEFDLLNKLDIGM